MNTFFKILAGMLLLFNGVGAVYGGWNLMSYPDGSSMGISLDWLKYTPFPGYFIPGIILFVANGLFSFAVLLALLAGAKNTPWLVMAQGAILTGWIMIQILMIQTVNSLHIIFGSMGFALILLGILLHRNNVGVWRWFKR
jgi:hypothetical protein